MSGEVFLPSIVGTRDWLKSPAWEAGELGIPIPDSPHAVSVCLPTLQAVLGYEEGDVQITSRMCSGYPRFFSNDLMARLHADLLKTHGNGNEVIRVFPNETIAQDAVRFLSRKAVASRVEKVDSLERGLERAWHAVLVLEKDERKLKLFWRYSGEILTSREVSLYYQEETPVSKEEENQAKTSLKERLASVYGVQPDHVFLFPSGMAAAYMVRLWLESLKPGGMTVQVDFPYVDVFRVQKEFGRGAHFTLLENEQDWAELETFAQRDALAGVFAEVPSNPLLRCVEVPRLSAWCQSQEIPFILDDTIATGAGVDALRHADVVSSSLTKVFSGTGDVMGGILVINSHSPWQQHFKDFLSKETSPEGRAWLAGINAVALEVRSRDFLIRARTISSKTRELLQWLREREEIDQLYYPDETSVSWKSLEREGGTGPGGLFSFTLKTGLSFEAFFNALQVSKGPSFGTYFTLACPYTLLAHYDELEWVAQCGVPRELIRVSVGLEEVDDLKSRFDTAFVAARAF